MLLLTSCNYTLLGIAIGDGGLLSGKPCPAPCFWNIYPGVTTKDEAIQIIQRHGPFAHKQMDNLIFYGESLSFDYNSNKIVQSIEFEPNPAIKISTLIAKYDVPDDVEIIYDSFSTPEHNYFDARLYFDSIHTYAMLEREEIFPAYSLNPDTRITDVTYYTKKSYDTLKASSTHTTKWVGYGDYKDPSP